MNIGDAILDTLTRLEMRDKALHPLAVCMKVLSDPKYSAVIDPALGAIPRVRRIDEVNRPTMSYNPVWAGNHHVRKGVLVHELIDLNSRYLSMGTVTGRIPGINIHSAYPDSYTMAQVDKYLKEHPVLNVDDFIMKIPRRTTPIGMRVNRWTHHLQKRNAPACLQDSPPCDDITWKVIHIPHKRRECSCYSKETARNDRQGFPRNRRHP